MEKKTAVSYVSRKKPVSIALEIVNAQTDPLGVHADELGRIVITTNDGGIENNLEMASDVLIAIESYSRQHDLPLEYRFYIEQLSGTRIVLAPLTSSGFCQWCGSLRSLNAKACPYCKQFPSFADKQ